jgi:hypothetical protein
MRREVANEAALVAGAKAEVPATAARRMAAEIFMIVVVFLVVFDAICETYRYR